MTKFLIGLLALGCMSAFAKETVYKCKQKGKADSTIMVKTSFWSGEITEINGRDSKDFRDTEPLSEYFDLSSRGPFKSIASSEVRKDAQKYEYVIFDNNDTAAYDTRFLTLEKEAYFLHIDRPSSWCFASHCRDNYRVLRKCIRQ